jgi:hypothetical protein
MVYALIAVAVQTSLMRADWVDPASLWCSLWYCLSFVDSPYFSNKEFISLSWLWFCKPLMNKMTYTNECSIYRGLVNLQFAEIHSTADSLALKYESSTEVRQRRQATDWTMSWITPSHFNPIHFIKFSLDFTLLCYTTDRNMLILLRCSSTSHKFMLTCKVSLSVTFISVVSILQTSRIKKFFLSWS